MKRKTEASRKPNGSSISHNMVHAILDLNSQELQDFVGHLKKNKNYLKILTQSQNINHTNTIDMCKEN